MEKRMRIIAVIAIAVVLTVFGASSEAKVMKFDHFSIDVPDGWQVDEDRENFTVTFLAPDNSAALTVAIFENEDGTDLEEFAKSFQKELKGKQLQKVEDGYMFSFITENNVESMGIVSAADGLVLFMTVIGEHDAIDAMVNSMEDL